MICEATLKRPVVLALGPHRGAASGISAHVNNLLSSSLTREFSLLHFQVGAEGRKEGLLARWLRLVASPFELAGRIIARSVAIVHINTALNRRAFWRDLAYLIVSKLCGVRVIYQVHGGALPLEFCAGNPLMTAVLRWTLSVADVVVVLAQVELDAYRHFVPGRHVELIPSAIDFTAYRSLTRPRRRPDAPVHVVYLGRLVREKGLYELLRGFAWARSNGTNARLTIAGLGPDGNRLKHAAANLGLHADVQFLEPAFGEQKLNLLASADLFVLASYSEGLPYALLEGMAAGAAIVATPVGGIPDVVVPGVHGLLVPTHDSQAIGQAIAQLAADRESRARMGAAARARIAAAYSLERPAREFSQLYAGRAVAAH
ncbi:MAG TPA: glycosyltransferase [Steroidobacteraceae bacterium]|nr:glycosyltransferase [Steroidobacteraceae bacterium]